MRDLRCEIRVGFRVALGGAVIAAMVASMHRPEDWHLAALIGVTAVWCALRGPWPALLLVVALWLRFLIEGGGPEPPGTGASYDNMTHRDDLGYSVVLILVGMIAGLAARGIWRAMSPRG